MANTTSKQALSTGDTSQTASPITPDTFVYLRSARKTIIETYGLHDTTAKLFRLNTDPDYLQMFRERIALSPRFVELYEDSPPPTKMQPALNSPTEEERLVDRFWQVKLGARKSRPPDQYRDQCKEEILRRKMKQRFSSEEHAELCAQTTVTQRWQAQGICGDDWVAGNGFKFWPHEGQPEPEPLSEDDEEDSDSDNDNDSDGDVGGVGDGGPDQRKGPVEATKEEEEQARRQVIEGREERQQARYAARLVSREKSRPFFQFVHQVSEERERLRLLQPDQQEGEGQPEREPQNTAADINTLAYEAVKARWIERKIWYNAWGILPGMHWKHEMPLKDLVVEEMGLENLEKLPANERSEALRSQPAEPNARDRFWIRLLERRRPRLLRRLRREEKREAKRKNIPLLLTRPIINLGPSALADTVPQSPSSPSPVVSPSCPASPSSPQGDENNEAQDGRSSNSSNSTSTSSSSSSTSTWASKGSNKEEKSRQQQHSTMPCRRSSRLAALRTRKQEQRMGTDSVGATAAVAMGGVAKRRKQGGRQQRPVKARKLGSAEYKYN